MLVRIVCRAFERPPGCVAGHLAATEISQPFKAGSKYRVVLAGVGGERLRLGALVEVTTLAFVGSPHGGR